MPAPETGTDWDLQLGSVNYLLRWIDPGSFLMGSPVSEAGRQADEAQHLVNFPTGFWMGSTEVDQALWTAVMGNNPSHFRASPDLPVETVSWDEAMSFCGLLTELLHEQGTLGTEWKVSLPTEAQWEYACRAGTSGAFAGSLTGLAWFLDNSNDRTHVVGSSQPNGWGLYDMHGNVWEWCLDWNAPYPSVPVTDPAPAGFGIERNLRGGAWYLPARYLRSANRYVHLPDYRDNATGFRIVLRQTVEPPSGR